MCHQQACRQRAVWERQINEADVLKLLWAWRLNRGGCGCAGCPNAALPFDVDVLWWCYALHVRTSSWPGANSNVAAVMTTALIKLNSSSQAHQRLLHAVSFVHLDAREHQGLRVQIETIEHQVDTNLHPAKACRHRQGRPSTQIHRILAKITLLRNNEHASAMPREAPCRTQSRIDLRC